MRLKIIMLMGILILSAGSASADRGVRAPDTEFQKEVEAFKGGLKTNEAYLRLVNAMEKSGALDLDDGPELFEKALHETIGTEPEQCRGLGAALTTRNFMPAAAYLAEVHCNPESQKELKKYREPIKAQAVKNWPNIDG